MRFLKKMTLFVFLLAAVTCLLTGSNNVLLSLIGEIVSAFMPLFILSAAICFLIGLAFK